MEPNQQLFSHFLRYRIEMQQGMAVQHDENTSGRVDVLCIRAAIGKLLRRQVHRCGARASSADLKKKREQ